MKPVSGEAVEITADSVQRGDVITIGGQPLVITDLISLGGRAKRVRFSSGETFTMHSRTRLSAVRPPVRPSGPFGNE